MKLIQEKLNNKNIVLMGLMGSGKSLIGKKLAKELKIKFIDIDNLIEKTTKKTIKEIFIENGEEYFREIEAEVALKALENQKNVISLGGGSILNAKVRKLIKKKYFTIYLSANIDILYKRLKYTKKRPLLTNVNIKNKIKELQKNRLKYYLDADLKINNSNKPSETIKKIIKYISKINEQANKI